MSWKPQIKEIGADWCSNSFVFETEDEARKSAENTFMKFFGCEGYRAIEVDSATNPVNYVWVGGHGNMPIDQWEKVQKGVSKTQ